MYYRFDNEYGESGDTQSYFRRRDDGLCVHAVPNYGRERRKYILVSKTSNTGHIDYFYRLDMTKPEYIGYPDENMVLTKEQICVLLDILSSDNRWVEMIKYTNWIHESDGDTEYESIPEDIPIPDYYQLLDQ